MFKILYSCASVNLLDFAIPPTVVVPVNQEPIDSSFIRFDDFIRVIVKDSDHSITPNHADQITVLVFPEQHAIELYPILPEPELGVRVNVVKPEIWPRSAYPDLRPRSPHLTSQLSRPLDNRHAPFHPALSIAELHFTIARLTYAEQSPVRLRAIPVH